MSKEILGQIKELSKRQKESNKNKDYITSAKYGIEIIKLKKQLKENET